MGVEQEEREGRDMAAATALNLLDKMSSSSSEVAQLDDFDDQGIWKQNCYTLSIFSSCFFFFFPLLWISLSVLHSITLLVPLFICAQMAFLTLKSQSKNVIFFNNVLDTSVYVDKYFGCMISFAFYKFSCF